MAGYFTWVTVGICAGGLNGLFGAGGGMVTVPLLSLWTKLEDRHIFSASLLLLIPICIVSLLFAQGWEGFSFSQALPYLLGGALGGVLAANIGKKIPSLWLHRVLGILVIWGGIRYLC